MNPYRTSSEPEPGDELPNLRREKGSIVATIFMMVFFLAPLIGLFGPHDQTLLTFAFFLKPAALFGFVMVPVVHAAREFIAVRRARRDAGWR